MSNKITNPSKIDRFLQQCQNTVVSYQFNWFLCRKKKVKVHFIGQNGSRLFIEGWIRFRFFFSKNRSGFCKDRIGYSPPGSATMLHVTWTSPLDNWKWTWGRLTSEGNHRPLPEGLLLSYDIEKLPKKIVLFSTK